MERSGSHSEQPKSSPRSWWRRQRSRARLLALVSCGVLALLFAIEALRWPDVASLVDTNPETTAFLERARDRLRREGRPEPQISWVPRAAIARDLQHAVVVSEDIGFFGHDGFDFAEIRIVVEETLSDRNRLRGASTLTQQLAKNLWLSPSRNPPAQAPGDRADPTTGSRTVEATNPRDLPQRRRNG